MLSVLETIFASEETRVALSSKTYFILKRGILILEWLKRQCSTKEIRAYNKEIFLQNAFSFQDSIHGKVDR